MTTAIAVAASDSWLNRFIFLLRSLDGLDGEIVVYCTRGEVQEMLYERFYVPYKRFAPAGTLKPSQADDIRWFADFLRSIKQAGESGKLRIEIQGGRVETNRWRDQNKGAMEWSADDPRRARGRG